MPQNTALYGKTRQILLGYFGEIYVRRCKIKLKIGDCYYGYAHRRMDEK